VGVFALGGVTGTGKLVSNLCKFAIVTPVDCFTNKKELLKKTQIKFVVKLLAFLFKENYIALLPRTLFL